MRIEETNIKQQDKELLTKEIKKKVGRRKIFKLGGCGNCLVILIIILLFLFLSGAWIVAQTGLINIPFFSHFYKEVEPLHWVNSSDEFSFENKLSSALGEISSDGVIPLEVVLTEEELTYLVRQLENSNQDKIRFIASQIAVDFSQVEFYTAISFPKNNLSSTIIISFVPQVVNGEIKLELQEVKLGNLPLPSVLGNLVIDKLFSDKMKLIGTAGLPVGEISDINLYTGEIIINTKVETKI